MSGPSASSSLTVLEVEGGGVAKVGTAAGGVVDPEAAAAEEGEVGGARLELDVEVEGVVEAVVDGVVGDARLELSVEAAVMVDSSGQLRSFNVGK